MRTTETTISLGSIPHSTTLATKLSAPVSSFTTPSVGSISEVGISTTCEPTERRTPRERKLGMPVPGSTVLRIREVLMEPSSASTTPLFRTCRPESWSGRLSTMRSRKTWPTLSAPTGSSHNSMSTTVKHPSSSDWDCSRLIHRNTPHRNTTTRISTGR